MIALCIAKMHQNKGALVILLAAGSSRRYSNHAGNNKHKNEHENELPNSEELKQLELLNGKSVISYSLEKFCNCRLVDEVIVMIPPGEQARFQNVINDLADNIKGNIKGKIKGNINKKLRCIKEGGKNRFDSTHLAIAELANESGSRSVLIHDAARPLVTTELVEKCIAALQTHPAVAVALPVTDTLGLLTSLSEDISKDASTATPPLQTKHNQEYKISKIATRSDYCLLQTPQGFQLQLLRDSFQNAADEGGDTSRWTDDCSVVLAHNPSLSIHKIEGDICNIKLTHKQDKQILESILHKQHDRSNS